MEQEDEGQSKQGRVRPAVKYVTWSAILAVLPLLVAVHQINAAYVNYHLNLIETWTVKSAKFYTREQADERFALRTTAVTVAEADSLKKTVESVDSQSKETARKVDSLLISSAVQLVIAAELRVDRLEENRQHTAEWRDDYARAREDLAKAVEYRNCLTAGISDDCDALRVW